MPNWCDTSYKILGDKESLKKIYSAIEELNSLPKPRVENGFGKLWLGCLVDYFGGKWEEIYCRGSIINYFFDEECLSIDTETAWGEMEDVRHFLERVFPNIKIYYMSEEPEMEEYYTNDKDGTVFHTKYFLDSCDVDEIEPDYFSSLEDVIEYLNVNMIDGLEQFHSGESEEYIKKALKDYSDNYDDKYIALHRFQIIDD